MTTEREVSEETWFKWSPMPHLCGYQREQRILYGDMFEGLELSEQVELLKKVVLTLCMQVEDLKEKVD